MLCSLHKDLAATLNYDIKYYAAYTKSKPLIMD